MKITKLSLRVADQLLISCIKTLCRLSNKWLSVCPCIYCVPLSFQLSGTWALLGKRRESRWGPVKDWLIRCSMWSTPVWTPQIMTARCVHVSSTDTLVVTCVSDLGALYSSAEHGDVLSSTGITPSPRLLRHSQTQLCNTEPPLVFSSAAVSVS